MKKILLILFLVCSLLLVCSPLIAQDAKVTSLMSKPLSDIPGKELLMITVEYPPGSSDPVHRHNAQALVYVLEGSVVMGVNGEKPMANPTARTDVLRRPQRYSHSWSQREQDDASQVLGSLAQRQRCTCSDSGEVALAMGGGSCAMSAFDPKRTSSKWRTPGAIPEIHSATPGVLNFARGFDDQSATLSRRMRGSALACRFPFCHD